MASSASRGPEGRQEGSGDRNEVVASAAQERKALRKLVDVRFKKVGQTAPEPEQQKKLDAVTFEKSKKYRFEGTVDRASFSSKLKEKSFYVTDAGFARDMLKNFDQIVLKFPSLSTSDGKAKLKTMLEFLVTSSMGEGKMKLSDGTFDHVMWKEKSEKFLGSDNLYGPEGLYNVILAYRRAVDKMRFRLRDSGAKATYELRSSGKSAERSVRLYEEDEEKEAVKLSEQKPDTQRQKLLDQAKNARKGLGEVFNEQMNDYLAERNNLMARISVALEKGQMKYEDASEYRDSLNGLSLRDAASKREVSDRDMARLELIDETIIRIKAAVVKAEKPVEKASVPREGSDARESRELAERILNASPMKARYELAEGQTLEQLAGVVALEAIKSVDPVAGKPVLDSLVKLIQPIILAALNNINKENIAKNAPSKIFVVDQDAQERVVTLILTELKKYSIKSNAAMRIKK